MSQISRRDVLRRGWFGALGVAAAAAVGAVVPELSMRSRHAAKSRPGSLTAHDQPFQNATKFPYLDNSSDPNFTFPASDGLVYNAPRSFK